MPGVWAAGAAVTRRLALAVMPPAVTVTGWRPCGSSGTSTWAVKLPSWSVVGAGTGVAGRPPTLMGPTTVKGGKPSPDTVTVWPGADSVGFREMLAAGTRWVA